MNIRLKQLFYLTKAFFMGNGRYFIFPSKENVQAKGPLKYDEPLAFNPHMLTWVNNNLALLRLLSVNQCHLLRVQVDESAIYVNAHIVQSHPPCVPARSLDTEDVYYFVQFYCESAIGGMYSNYMKPLRNHEEAALLIHPTPVVSMKVTADADERVTFLNQVLHG